MATKGRQLRTAPIQPVDERPLRIVAILIILAAVIQICWSYPSHFFPRHWDEAVYARDALAPGAMMGEYVSQATSYAPAKLGYGLPLSAAVAIAGPNGMMYLSTLCWLLTIIIIGVVTARAFGLTAALFGAAFLAYSPLFGKYIAEVGPTTMAALGFAVLWAVHRFHRFWLTGLVIGLIAFIDFKWAVPAGLSLIVCELTVGSGIALKRRLISILLIGVVALTPLAIALLVHKPYSDYLRHYLGHAQLVGFAPSTIVLYYLVLFGSAFAALLAAVGLTIRSARSRFHLNPGSFEIFWSAIVFSAVPVLFYSVFGSLKALRFYAVSFPLFAVAVGVTIPALFGAIASRLKHGVDPRRVTAWVTALAAGAVLVVGSDGPARQWRIPAGFEPALARLRSQTTESGSVSSYLWPVVYYGWQFPLERAPFLLWGLIESDLWAIRDPVLDHVTTEMRMRLSNDRRLPPDSVWSNVNRALMDASSVLFTVPNDFYSSDYFLAENVVGGIPVLRRWRTWRNPRGNSLELRLLDPEKSRRLKQRRPIPPE